MASYTAIKGGLANVHIDSTSERVEARRSCSYEGLLESTGIGGDATYVKGFGRFRYFAGRASNWRCLNC